MVGLDAYHVEREGGRVMKLGALDHPKTLDLAARLRVELPTAIGYLELLWAYTAKHAPQGNVGKWPDGSIARSCYWNADPTAFVTALADAGFIDRDPEHRYLIHDWRDHAPRWVSSKLSRAGVTIVECSADSSADHNNECTADCSPDCTRHSKARHGLARLGMGSTRAAARPARSNRRKSTEEPPEFQAIRSAFPKRAGSHRWSETMGCCQARLRDGNTWDEMQAGTARYVTHITATGKERTEYVMQAKTFFGPGLHFLEPWDAPATKADRRLAANLSAADEFMRRTEGG